MNASSTTMKMHIPNDVIVEILSRLPAKSLLRFRWVCKYWFKLITDPDFVKMHLNHVLATNNPLILMTPTLTCQLGFLELWSLDSRDDDTHPVYIKLPLSFNSLQVDFDILGSCNGLLCIKVSTSHDKIFIWNPCTQEYKMIWRDDHSDTIPKHASISYGFGYDGSIDDYKVIRNVCLYDDNGSYNDETLVDVYTLGTNSSKRLCNSRFFLFEGSGLFINGDLYWIASLIGSEPYKTIVVFDIAKEEYREIISKPYLNHNESNSMSLGKLKGYLCVLNVTDSWQSVDVWVMNHNVDDMKKDYSWYILYTISAPLLTSSHLKLLKICRNGEILMLMSERYLILYDPKCNQKRYLTFGTDIMKIETYMQSLVPIKGGTYIDGPHPTSSIAMDKSFQKKLQWLK